MRFLHTADWHLGRSFHQTSLLEDQEHALQQFIDLSREAGPDAVLVAGDIYDRAVPPADAVRLLDWVLGELVLGQRVPVILIAGNHDSPERIGFASRLLAGEGLHICGSFSETIDPVVLKDDHGPVRVYPLPYADPPVVRERLEDAGVRFHDEAMAAITGRITGSESGGRSVLVAHCFATGGEESESERPLSIGGVGTVQADHFTGFSYTALGHLHQPQFISERVRYSGSLLKYSFSEADHEKSVSIVSLEGTGNVSVEEAPLTPRRDVRILEGDMEDLLSNSTSFGPTDDYLLIRLTDRVAILDAIGKLRQAFPNVLHLERPGLFREGTVEVAGKERLKESERDLFRSFFREMTGEDLTDDQSTAFDQVVESMDLEEREVTP